MKDVMLFVFMSTRKFFAQVFFCMHMRVHARECECVYVNRDYFSRVELAKGNTVDAQLTSLNFKGSFRSCKAGYCSFPTVPPLLSA